MALARDVGNPSRADPFFPTVRQKDWYIGASWATGIGGGTRQEESSSEVCQRTIRRVSANRSYVHFCTFSSRGIFVSIKK